MLRTLVPKAKICLQTTVFGGWPKAKAMQGMNITFMSETHKNYILHYCSNQNSSFMPDFHKTSVTFSVFKAYDLPKGEWRDRQRIRESYSKAKPGPRKITRRAATDGQIVKAVRHPVSPRFLVK